MSGLRQRRPGNVCAFAVLLATGAIGAALLPPSASGLGPSGTPPNSVLAIELVTPLQQAYAVTLVGRRFRERLRCEKRPDSTSGKTCQFFVRDTVLEGTVTGAGLESGALRVSARGDCRARGTRVTVRLRPNRTDNLCTIVVSARADEPEEDEEGDCLQQVRVGFALAQVETGCLRETRAGSRVFRGDEGLQVWVGGFRLVPRHRERVVIDVGESAIVGSQSGGSLPVYVADAGAGEVEALPVAVAAQQLDLLRPGTLSRIVFRNLLGIPLEGSLRLEWKSGGAESALSLDVDLKVVLGDNNRLLAEGVAGGPQDAPGASSGAKVALTLRNLTGPMLDLAELRFEQTRFLPGAAQATAADPLPAETRAITLRRFLGRYERVDGRAQWTGQLAILIPVPRDPLPLELQGTFAIRDGLPTTLGLAIDNLNRPIANGIFLQRLAGEIRFQPRFGAELQVGGTTAQRIVVNGVVAELALLTGTMRLGSLAEADCRNGPAVFQLEVALTVPAAEPFARVAGELGACVYWGERVGPLLVRGVEVTGSVEATFGPPPFTLLVANATVSGMLATSGTTLSGTGTLRIPLLPDLAGEAVISSIGAGACASATEAVRGVASAIGIGHRWGETGSTLLSACDLGPYRAVLSTSAARTVAGTGPGATTVEVPAGLSTLVVRATDVSASPSLRVVGGGREVSWRPGQPATVTGAVAVIPSEADQRTFVVLARPEPGSYEIESDAGTAIDVAEGLPAVALEGTVTRAGDRLVLAWRATGLAGRTVEFVERGEGFSRRLGRPTAASSGTVRFVPTVALQQARRIEAIVASVGIARTPIVVARFQAPAPARLARPVRLSATRRGSTIVTTWHAVRGATGYLVELRSGRRVLATVLTKRLRVAFTGAPERRLTVRVVAQGRVTTGLGASVRVPRQGTAVEVDRPAPSDGAGQAPPQPPPPPPPPPPPLPPPPPADTEPCTITGTDRADLLQGTPGRDVICGLGGDDVIEAGAGDDVVRAGPGDDLVRGGAGDDRLAGDAGRDALRGDGGSDVLVGGDDGDELVGGPGDDTLRGEAGADRLIGCGGRDIVVGDLGDDHAFGDGSSPDCQAAPGDPDPGDTVETADRLEGGPGADYLKGGRGGDRIRGGADADELRGGPGVDELEAVDGERDVVDGGPDCDAARADQVDRVTTVERTGGGACTRPPGEPAPP